MKLRIRGNSIRLRLGRGEVDALVGRGVVVESTEFGPGERLEYALRTSADVPRPIASFRAGRIDVLVPAHLAKAWAAGPDVGISADQVIGPVGGAETRSLQLLIEKDFACLHPPPGEDQTDAFPHPEGPEGAVCPADE